MLSFIFNVVIEYLEYKASHLKNRYSSWGSDYYEIWRVSEQRTIFLSKIYNVATHRMSGNDRNMLKKYRWLYRTSH